MEFSIVSQLIEPLKEADMPKAFDDTFFREKFKELVVEYSIRTVVETGTWLGDSLVDIAKIANRAISIEIQPHFFQQAMSRLMAEGYSQIPVPWYIRGDAVSYTKGESEITLIRGNSPDVIMAIIEYLPQPILFFLDAHWLDYWPIKDEIRAIRPRPESIIIIHDFKVPGKAWRYDSYKGVALDYDLVKDDLAFVNPNYVISYNEECIVTGTLYAVPPSAR